MVSRVALALFALFNLLFLFEASGHKEDHQVSAVQRWGLLNILVVGTGKEAGTIAESLSSNTIGI
jgi:hypothetical protein